MLTIDIIEGCNFECYFCPAKDISKNYYMELDLFKRIILEAKELGITVVDLVPLRGEPFLHPDFYEMLDFSNRHMKEVQVITNISAANIVRLKEVNLSNTHLTVSYYGATPEKFKEMTGRNIGLFNIVHKKLDELKEHNIPHTIGRRDIEWDLNYDDVEHLPPKGSTKCAQHQRPRISPQGDVTFCKFIPGRSGYIPDVNFGNLHTTSLKDILTNPLRYKFFETESICKKYCVDLLDTCEVKPTLVSFKLMSQAKKNYQENIQATETAYKAIETAVDKSNEQIKSSLQLIE